MQTLSDLLFRIRDHHHSTHLHHNGQAPRQTSTGVILNTLKMMVMTTLATSFSRITQSSFILDITFQENW